MASGRQQIPVFGTVTPRPPACPFLEGSSFHVGCEDEFGPVHPQMDSSARAGAASVATCLLQRLGGLFGVGVGVGCLRNTPALSPAPHTLLPEQPKRTLLLK